MTTGILVVVFAWLALGAVLTWSSLEPYDRKLILAILVAVALNPVLTPLFAFLRWRNRK